MLLGEKVTVSPIVMNRFMAFAKILSKKRIKKCLSQNGEIVKN